MVRLNKASGIERVAYLGGFIEERLVTMLKEKYAPALVNRVRKNATLDNNIWKICDETEKVFKAITVFPEHTYYDGGVEHGKKALSPFAEWLISQEIRCRTLELKNGKNKFWESEDLDITGYSSAEKLIAVELRILSYMLGHETGKAMTPKEIGNLPEFDCDYTWIERVIEEIKDTFEYNVDPSIYTNFVEQFERKEEKING